MDQELATTSYMVGEKVKDAGLYLELKAIKYYAFVLNGSIFSLEL